MLMCPVSHPEILVNISVLVNLSEKILVGIEPSRLIQLLAEFPYRHCSAVTALFDFNLRKNSKSNRKSINQTQLPVCCISVPDSDGDVWLGDFQWCNDHFFASNQNHLNSVVRQSERALVYPIQGYDWLLNKNPVKWTISYPVW